MSNEPDKDGAASEAPRGRAALLAHIRHELASPSNGISGYTEMLLEDAAEQTNDDLQKILAAARQLRRRVNELLHPDRTSAQDLDLDAYGAHIRHELRTPINAINGYSDMLIEDATDAGQTAPVADVVKIHEAGRRRLTLIDVIVHSADLEA